MFAQVNIKPHVQKKNFVYYKPITTQINISQKILPWGEKKIQYQDFYCSLKLYQEFLSGSTE